MRNFQNSLPDLQNYIEAGQVRYVFKDFPIRSIHHQAQKTHLSTCSALELGGDNAFWEMHDLLLENQASWAGSAVDVELVKDLAADMDLNLLEFSQCLDSDRFADAVSADLNDGLQLGVTGAPSFFIIGQLVVGAQPFSMFQEITEALLTAES